MYPALQDAGVTIAVSYGAYRVEDGAMSADVMSDRANMVRKGGSARRGGSCVYFHDASLKESMQWEQELESAMGPALASGEFSMYLQPKCLAANGAVVGFEALVRWLQFQQAVERIHQAGFTCSIDDFGAMDVV